MRMKIVEKTIHFPPLFDILVSGDPKRRRFVRDLVPTGHTLKTAK